MIQTKSIVYCAYLWAILLVVVVVVAVSKTADGQPTVTGNEADYWRKRRAEFYANTTFELSEDNQRLLGGKYTSIRTGHLPLWFDYELFKRVFNKPKRAATVEEERARHNIYLNTCLRTIKTRTLFRMLTGTHDAFITSQADQFYDERNAQLMSSSSSSSASRTDNAVDLTQTTSDDNNKQDNNNIGENVVEFVAQLGADRSASSSGGNQVEVDATNEQPLDRAIRLMRLELDQVESRNQVETYLKGFKVSVF